MPEENKSNPLAPITIKVPLSKEDAEKYECTQEYRPVRQGEYYLSIDSAKIIKQWEADVPSLLYRIIFRLKKPKRAPAKPKSKPKPKGKTA